MATNKLLKNPDPVHGADVLHTLPANDNYNEMIDDCGTNFRNILPQPMVMVMKACWTATMMLSISTKSHIIWIYSFWH